MSAQHHVANVDRMRKNRVFLHFLESPLGIVMIHLRDTAFTYTNHYFPHVNIEISR